MRLHKLIEGSSSPLGELFDHGILIVDDSLLQELTL